MHLSKFIIFPMLVEPTLVEDQTDQVTQYVSDWMCQLNVGGWGETNPVINYAQQVRHFQPLQNRQINRDNGQL